MIDPASQAQLNDAIADCIHNNQHLLDSLRAEIQPLKTATRTIQARASASISLVGTDGGNNQIRFDPFLIQLIRVVDSSNNEYCLEAVSPSTPLEKLKQNQFNQDGSPKTPLGEMMYFLEVDSLTELSQMIRPNPHNHKISHRWVEVYRELVEWATLFKLLNKDYGTDTLIIFDGLLRSKVFARDLFQKLLQGMKARIDQQWQRNRRHIYLAGIAKQSKVLSRYRLAMALEGILQTKFPAYVEVPRDIEAKAYLDADYARGDDQTTENNRSNRFVGGKLFLVKFGSHRHDPIWPIDIFVPQVKEAQSVLGSMLTDALHGFPVPHYPRCLQQAHEHAALVDFDFDILQDMIYKGVRASLGNEANALDAFQLQDTNLAQLRYE